MMNSDIGPDAGGDPKLPGETEIFVAKDIGWRTSRQAAGELASEAGNALTGHGRKPTDLTSAKNLRSFLDRASAARGATNAEELERVVRATLELFTETAATGKLTALKAELPEGFFPKLETGPDTSDTPGNS